MYIMPIYYTLHTLVYKYSDLVPLPKNTEDRHCLMVLGGTIAWTVIWIALNSIQKHPLWNALRSSFIAVLGADISVMLYIWNNSKKTKVKKHNIVPLEHTTNALNNFYNSIHTELDTRKCDPDSIRAKEQQELVLSQGQRRIDAVTHIQKWWRNKKPKTEEFHSIISANC